MISVLVGCECSHTVSGAFRALGHEAWSCDIQPADDPDDDRWHMHRDVFEMLKPGYWDLIILHPPCTALAVSGNRWYGSGQKLNHKRKQALQWTTDMWEQAKLASPHVALENPVGVLPHSIGPASQWVQPWEFGHGETKKTGYWLPGLDPLRPTDVVDGREQRIWRMGPSDDRAKIRSKTYQGIADAMAEQWSEQVLTSKSYRRCV